MKPNEAIVEEIAASFPDRVKNAKFYHGRGCPDCNFTGYKSRIALFEIMILDDAIRSMVVRQRPANEIKQRAVEHGLVTLRKDGWSRVLDGMTSIDEEVRVAHKTDAPSGPTT